MPHNRKGKELRHSIEVANTIVSHKVDLPNLHNIKRHLVKSNYRIINAIWHYTVGKVRIPKEIDGVYGAGGFVEKAAVLKYAA